MEWLSEAGLNLRKQGIQLDCDNPNLPLASLMRIKEVELNNEKVQSLKWSGVVLQGEDIMSGDDGRIR